MAPRPAPRMPLATLAAFALLGLPGAASAQAPPVPLPEADTAQDTLSQTTDPTVALLPVLESLAEPAGVVVPFLVFTASQSLVTAIFTR